MEALHLQAWVIPAFLGLGLAAASGLRTFLPITLLALAARFGLFGATLNPHAAWLTSTPFLIGLVVATIAELAADKIPIVDHFLGLVGTITRPAAGALAAGAVFAHLDPGTAALAGLVIGVPTALAFHAVQSGARVVSTTTTAGIANPYLSLIEDLLSGLMAVAAIAAPVLAAVAVAGLLWLLIALRRRRRMRRPAAG